MPYSPLMGGADPQGSESVPTLQVSTQTATTTVTPSGKSASEIDGRATLHVSVGIVLGAIALIWLSAYALK